MKDDTILRGLQKRDPDVINHVINKYARLLWPIADAILKTAGTTQDVEECVADVFIHLWEHPEKFDPGRGSLKSYLCILLRSRALDRCRQLTRHHTIPLDDVLLTEGPGMHDRLLQKQTRVQLRRLLDTLEEPAREILLRRYYYGQKPRQIALALDMTVKQVDNSLYRTKKALRTALSEEGGSPWDA